MSATLPHSFTFSSGEAQNPWTYTDQNIRDSVRATHSTKELSSYGARLELMLGAFEVNDPSIPVDALDNAWAHYCYEATSKARRLGVHPVDKNKLRGQVVTNPKLREDLYDNFVEVALALAQTDELFDSPAVAWCAFNKHNYVGLRDEIVILRLLLCLGFNPNVPDDNGMTALHYMAWQKHSQDSHPRAVRLLLKAGANPNAKNKDGKTPLDFMLDRQDWTENLQLSALQMAKAGGCLFHSDNGNRVVTHLGKANQTTEQILALMQHAFVMPKDLE